MLYLLRVSFLATKRAQDGTYVAYNQRKTFPLLDHRCVMCVTTASTNVQWQIPEAEQNMDLEPRWLAAAVLEKRNLRPAALQAGC